MEPITRNGFYKHIPDNWFFWITGCWYICDCIAENRQNSCFFSWLVVEILSFYTADIFTCAFFLWLIAYVCDYITENRQNSCFFSWHVAKILTFYTDDIFNCTFYLRLIAYVCDYFGKNRQNSHFLHNWLF